jgi:predicted nucleic-acid-binding Zn-ribbon protein
MKTIEKQKAICPKCGAEYFGRPALSRMDGKTLICPDCGTREALDSIGISEKEQNEILAVIHNHYNAE